MKRCLFPAALAMVVAVAGCSQSQPLPTGQTTPPETTVAFGTPDSAVIDPGDPLRAMTAACLVVLTWQEAFLASDLTIPDLSPVDDALLLLSAFTDFDPARFLADDLRSFRAFYALRGQSDVDVETALGMAGASNRAIYEVEVLCRYLADGQVELAGELPDPTLISLEPPGALEAMRACRLWVSLYTDTSQEDLPLWWAIALSNAEQASDLDAQWVDLHNALLRLSEAGLDGFVGAFDLVSHQCQSVIQVPVRMRPSSS